MKTNSRVPTLDTPHQASFFIIVPMIMLIFIINNPPTKISKELLKSFIIGSSLPAFIILVTAVSYYIRIEKSAVFDYHKYSKNAPLYLGIMAVISKFISLKFNISLRISYFIISIISVIHVWADITGLYDYPAYNFKTKERWYSQYLQVFIGHLFIYNCIIYPLDSYLC